MSCLVVSFVKATTVVCSCSSSAEGRACRKLSHLFAGDQCGDARLLQHLQLYVTWDSRGICDSSAAAYESTSSIPDHVRGNGWQCFLAMR